jgi:type III pantothenate kinase
LNLIIDIGNTNAKVALVKDSVLQFKESVQLNELIFLMEKLTDQYSEIKSGILSSVVNVPEDVLKKLNEKCNLLVFDSTTKIPITNNYKNPKTLGKDRLAAAVGACSNFKNSNTLIIDVGTCLKIDFVNSANEYCGGMISPGLNMRFKALHTFTDKLPLITEIHKEVEITADTTKNSLLSGVMNGMNFEINGFIKHYLKKYSDLIIVTTGGDINFFELEPKNCIFARPNLIIEGLNEILLFNAKK